MGDGQGLAGYYFDRASCQGAGCFGAGAVVGSSCIVGEQSFIGLNATILEGIIIGAKSIVGAGVCMKENLSECSMACLTSSNYIVKQYDSQTIKTKLTHRR